MNNDFITMAHIPRQFHILIVISLSLLASFIWGILVMFKNVFPYQMLSKIYHSDSLKPVKRMIEPIESQTRNLNQTFSVLKEYDRTRDFGIHYIWVNGSNHATFIQSNGGKNILIDCGRPSESSLIVKYLKDIGVSSIDHVMITMYDKDHVGGVQNIIDNFQVKSFILENNVNSQSRTENKKEVEKLVSDYEIVYPKVGDKFEIFSNVYVEKLGPDRIFTSENCSLAKPDRCNSTIYKFSSPLFDMLLMSDAQIPAEQDLISADHDLSADLLEVGHHGGGPVNSFEFLDAVKPNVAIINTGRKDGPADRLLECKSKLEYIDDLSVYVMGDVGSVIIQPADDSDKNYEIMTSSNK